MGQEGARTHYTLLTATCSLLLAVLDQPEPDPAEPIESVVRYLEDLARAVRMGHEMHRQADEAAIRRQQREADEGFSDD